MLYNSLIGSSGFAEISGQPPSPVQWKIIQDHLGLVFNKVTPTRSIPIPPAHIPERPIFKMPTNPDGTPLVAIC